MPDGTQQWAASEAEAVRLEQLLAMQSAGRIIDLKCQPRFDLAVNNVAICTFRPDFSYQQLDDNGDPLPQRSIEEVKGVELDDYKLRMKLFRALFPNFKVTVIKPGQKLGSRALWMDLHWKDKLPD